MIAFIAKNLGTIIISALLLGIVTWISISLIKKKKSGKSIGCNCNTCPEASFCQKK